MNQENDRNLWQNMHVKIKIRILDYACMYKWNINFSNLIPKNLK